MWRPVVFLEVEEGGQDLNEEAVKVYLIRFIADLPQGWYTGNMIEYLYGGSIPCATIIFLIKLNVLTQCTIVPLILFIMTLGKWFIATTLFIRK